MMKTISRAAVLCLLLAATIEARFSPRLYPKDERFSGTWKKVQMSVLSKGSPVQHMAVAGTEKLKSALLLQGRPLMPQRTPGSSAGDPFHWESCGPEGQVVDIQNLTITPSPLSFPGPLTFGFDIIFHDTISSDAKVSADVKLEIDASGTWIEIPCIGSIGSCSYDDLCSLTDKIQCPPDLVDEGIPCTCPFDKGEYKLKKYEVDVDTSLFLTGDYRAQATLTDPVKGQIACYKINFSVA